ncbi:MAG: MFS transporter [Alphaproteobacteria bacterium]
MNPPDARAPDARAPDARAPEGPPRGLRLRLSAFYGGYFLVVGVLAPFWPLFLSFKGLGPQAIGLILTLTIFARVLAGPAVGRIGAWTGAYRRPMYLSGLAALALAALLFLADGFWPILMVSFAAFFAFSCQLPLGEALTLRFVSVDKDYARVRLWGSVSFILAAGLGGYLLNTLSTPPAETILVFILVSLGVASLTAFTLPEGRAPASTRHDGSLRRLLAQRPFGLMILAVGLIHGGHTVFYGFSTLHWIGAGLSTTVVGLLWAEGVVAEILFFAFGAGLARRLGVVNLLALAALAGMVRWWVFAVTTDPVILASVQWLHGASFGAMHLAAMQFIVRAVPERRAVAAQAAYAALGNGLAIGLGMLLSGFLYQAFGGAAFYSSVGLSFLGLIAVLALARAWDGRVVTSD